jgi:predicted NUDIX family phosphoesterase
MKAQFILAADQNFFSARYPAGFFIHPQGIDEAWAEGIAPYLAIRQREALELNADYRQLLPYVVVRQIGNDSRVRFFAYERTSLVGEQRLAGKVSIGIGGHIDACDVQYGDRGEDGGPLQNSIPDLLSTLRVAARREVEEELVVTPTESQPLRRYRGEVLDLVFANSLILHHEGVQRVHAGILMFADAPGHVSLKCKEKELSAIGFLTASELLRDYDGRLEVWSQLYLESIAKIG